MSAELKNEDKPHLSVVITGHVDAGKSTVTGRLIFEMGGIPERDMKKLEEEADALGKSSFKFAFFMDKTKEERARGITIICTTKEFFTPKYHYTIIDAPGHRDFLKNMLSGASQADVGVLMIPADGGFGTAIAQGDHKAGEVQGQTRQHARLLNLLGVKQLIIGVNKMDEATAGYSESRFNEIRDEMRSMLCKVGWPKKFVTENVPIIPISGWQGDNLMTKSENMAWWKGCDVKMPGTETSVHLDTLHDCLDKFASVPKRKTTGPLRVPISGCFNLPGKGTIVTGRVETGTLLPGSEVRFLPVDTPSLACTGKVFSIEMHHRPAQSATAGDNVGMCIKGLSKENMPSQGCIMVLADDKTIGTVKKFTAQVQVLDHPNELKVGYTPLAMVRTSKSAVKLTEIVWKSGKETNNQKVKNPPCLKSNDMAELVFEPQQPFVVEKFDLTEGLGRIGILEGPTILMLGKVINVEY